MIDPRVIELINLRIDGQISSAQEQELQGILDRDEPARRYAQQLKLLVAAMESRAREMPPQELKQQILSAAAEKESHSPQRRPYSPSPASILRGPLRWVAAALLMGIALGWLLGRGAPGTTPIDISQLRGTMESSDSGKTLAQAFSFEIELALVDVCIRRFRSGEAQFLEVVLEPHAEIEWVLVYDPARIQPTGIQGNHLCDLHSSRGKIRIRQDQADRWLLSFVSRDGLEPVPMEFSIFRDGELLLRRTIDEP